MSRTTSKQPKSLSVVRAVSYCRISSDPTGREAGVERQHVDTDKIAADRSWTLVERVVDNDRSASRYAKRAREGWTRIMEMIEAGEVDAVVAYDLDRLIRQPKELERLIDAAERGLQVVTANGSIDLATGGGRMVARTLCNVAAMEADRVSERMKSKLRHDALNGKAHWVRRPFGYNLDGTVVPAEAKWFETMVGWIVDDGISATKVAQRLNQAGVVQASGVLWQSAGVKFLVTSPRNIGKRTYHGEIVGDASWPALIDEDRWRAACGALALRSDSPKGGRRSLLTGMVRCGKCGCSMIRTNGTVKGAFRCHKYADIVKGCGQSISAPAVEQLISAMVLERIGEVRGGTLRETTGVEEVDRLRAEMADLADMAGRGELTMAEWKAVREPLTTRLAAAEATLARSEAGSALARLTGDAATLADRWDELDVDLRRKLIGLVVERIEIGAGRHGVLDLDRITPIWRA